MGAELTASEVVAVELTALEDAALEDAALVDVGVLASGVVDSSALASRSATLDATSVDHWPTIVSSSALSSMSMVRLSFDNVLPGLASGPEGLPASTLIGAAPSRSLPASTGELVWASSRHPIANNKNGKILAQPDFMVRHLVSARPRRPGRSECGTTRCFSHCERPDRPKWPAALSSTLSQRDVYPCGSAAIRAFPCDLHHGSQVRVEAEPLGGSVCKCLGVFGVNSLELLADRCGLRPELTWRPAGGRFGLWRD